MGAASNSRQSFTSGEIPDTAIREELERILASAAFGKAERPGRFLRHLVETGLRGEPHLLKESVLGVEVFQRPPSWDPRLDPVVRQEASRLRKRLSRFYETEGAGSPIRIELPVGTYAPLFARPVEPAAVEAAPLPHSAGPSHQKRVPWLAVLGTIALLGLAAGAWGLIGRATVATHRPRSDPEELYLRGIYFWEQRTPQSLTQAVDLFTQAIVRDPDYALAYVGLANCYNLLREFAAMPEREAYPRALAATRRALELDDRSAEAHASLAFITFWWNWNAAAADREFRRALSLDPSYATAHHWYATFLVARGRFSEALEQIGMAQKLKPASTSILADKGLILSDAGRDEEAVALLKQIETEDPKLLSSYRYLADIYLDQGNSAAYLAEMKRGAALATDTVSRAIVAAASGGFDAGARAGMLQRILEAQMQLHSQGLVDNYALARTCARLGLNSDAMGYLEAASLEAGSTFLGYRIDPALRGLRSGARFQRLDAQFEPRISAGTFPVRN